MLKSLILFGFLIRDGIITHDIDITVKLFKKNALLGLGYIASHIAEALKVSVDNIGIVDLDTVNLALLYRIFNDGIIIKDEKNVSGLIEEASMYPDALIELRM